ncbi:hypothetical protein N7493_009432 [Penicillium malachiteum]|uniref:Uncharacterized protein n=1 Tax=Penicillium malachiteum TaxID=1324776 RepID=A0AAD6HEL5_9EURO|nr:hypothetical protein N7493_009432 [Penicillium malachiteum]
MLSQSGDYGSTCVNRAMEDDLGELLKDEPCFLNNKKSMEHQLSHNLFRGFENELKRNFDSGEDLYGYAYLSLPGLEENAAKGFGKGMIQVKSGFETTVSRGTVHRALDKSNGPSRHTIANIGILQSEPYDPKKFLSHREAPPDRNSLNKKRYVYDTVQWIIKKGQLADFNDLAKERNHRVFSADEAWEIKQSIYYNTLIDNPEDHYPVDHERNAG